MRGAGRGPVPGDGPRHGLPVRARPAQHADRDAARRSPRRRPRGPSQTYYACLLSHSGCTTDAHVAAGGLRRLAHDASATRVIYGSGREVLTGLIRALPDPGSAAPARALQVARRLPRMAREQRPHLTAVLRGRGDARRGARALRARCAACSPTCLERWDGHGPLGRAKGEEIPLPMRIVHVAVDAAFQRLLGGEERVVRLVRERAGHAFDPEVAACLTDDAERILALDDARLGVGGDARVRAAPAAAARGRGARSRARRDGQLRRSDLAVSRGSLHRRGGAGRGGGAALPARRGAASSRCAARRSSTTSDGSRSIARIWQKPGPLTADELEQVRLHPYHSERVLARSAFLAALAPVAGAHHERLDGSGYHRGVAGADLALPGAPARGRRRVPRDDRAAPAPRSRSRPSGRRRSSARRPAPDGSTPTR